MSGDLGPVARGILDTGRDGDDPTPGDRARVRASLMRAVAIGGGAAIGLTAAGKASASIAPKAAAGAAAVAKTASTFGVAKVIGFITIAIAVGGGGYAISGRAASRNESTKTVGSVAAAPSNEPTKAATQDLRPGEAPTPSEIAKSNDVANEEPAAKEIIAEPAKDAPKTALRVAPGSSAAAVDPLALEVERITEARRAAAAGDGSRALAILDAIKGSQLTEERSAVRVRALCAAGRVDEAKATASRFVSAHPQSIHVDSMRHACEGDRSAR
jgi:hypothetical protein